MNKLHNKLRVAVIGAGMGRYGILPAFLLNAKVQVVAVCTSHRETADKFAKAYNIPQAFDSWEALLRQEIDVFAVATPPAVQAVITRAILERGKPVFLEKQIATELGLSRQLYELSCKEKVPTCVNYIFPYLRTWMRLHSYLKEGRLGQIRQVFLNWRMESYDNYHRTVKIWKTDDKQGGGVLQHFLSHSFFYLENLFGKIKELRCTLRPAPDLNSKGSAFASLDLVFEVPLIVHIAASNSACAGPGHSLEIYGSEGSLLLKNESKDPVSGFKLYYAKRGQEMELVDSEINDYSSLRGDSRILPTSYLVSAFVNSIQGVPTPHPTIADGHRVQVLLDCANMANVKQSFVTVVE